MPEPQDAQKDDESTASGLSLPARLAYLETEIKHYRAILGKGRGPEDSRPAAKTRASQVRSLIEARTARDQLLGTRLFSDPAWDMLVEAFAWHIEGVRLTISELCEKSSAPETTALRWLKKLEEVNLLERQSDPVDRRRTYLVLTTAAVSGLDRYFELLASASAKPSELDAI